MKKLSVLFVSLLVVTVFTACNNNDDSSNTQTFTMTINSRAIDGDDVVFSQGTGKADLDYTNMLIKFNGDYKDANGLSHTFATPDMKMTGTNTAVRHFTNVASSTYTGIEGLDGYIDFSTGMMWYTFEVGGVKVVSTSCLLYAYTMLYAYVTTTITNPDNGNHSSHDHSAYLFGIDTKGETCTMLISNFIPTIGGSVQANEIQYKNLTMTPTATGYTITAAEAESSYRGFYTITDLNVNLNDQGRVIEGSFKCNGLEFTISGKMFPNDVMGPQDL